jgi:plasminogen activator inhibitor 1 RNA-binding protein
MFAALNDSDSDDEAPKQVQKAPAPAPVVAKVERKPERKPRAQQREDRPPRTERDNAPYGGDDKISNPAADRERQGKGKGERRSEGKGKGKGASRGDSGREFPRRSATGRGRENAKAGAGKFNWGKDDAQPPAEGAEPTEGAEAAPAPIEAAEPVEEEEPTMSLEEYEKLNTEKLAALNLNKREERVVEADADAVVLDTSTKKVEDQYECMFHDLAKHGRKDKGKKNRAGAKQADLVLNMKFVDENADTSKGKGKGERRSKGDGRKGGGASAGNGKGAPREPKQNIDLSNDMAFPTLGA